MHPATGEQRFPIDTRVLRSMLDRVRCIRCACDLDLLLFFHRHPCSLLASDRIFAHLGYAFQQAALSLDGLVDSGVLTRSRGRSGAACLYVLETRGLGGDALSSLLRIAATPAGRQGLMRLLKSGSGEHVASPGGRMSADRSAAA
jgi:hypothetical protein